MKSLWIRGLLIGGFVLCMISTMVWGETDLIPPTRMLEQQDNPMGYLSIFSEPTGLVVYLDKKKIGETPIFSVELEPGTHIVKIKNAETQVAITQGESKYISLHKGAFIDIKPRKNQQLPVQEAREAINVQASKTRTVNKPPEQPKDPLYWPLNPEGPIE